MRNMKLAFCLLIVGMAAASFHQSFELSASADQTQDKAAKPKPEIMSLGCSVIDPVDECIQARFSKADNRFGMYRMLPATLHLNYFIPETKDEREAVETLSHEGWTVGFYLAGRKILDEGSGKDWRKGMARSGKHPVIGGPMLIAPHAGQQFRDQQAMIESVGLPDPVKVEIDARKAMRAFDTRNRYEFEMGEWTFEVRPIRAQESCLKCHNNDHRSQELSLVLASSSEPVKIGDALGVAMYAYTRKK